MISGEVAVSVILPEVELIQVPPAVLHCTPVSPTIDMVPVVPAYGLIWILNDSPEAPSPIIEIFAPEAPAADTLAPVTEKVPTEGEDATM